jgi:hypothetical protein
MREGVGARQLRLHMNSTIPPEIDVTGSSRGMPASAMWAAVLCSLRPTAVSPVHAAVAAAPLRHLVVWRGRSRHTYGFEGEFDLPRLELEALLSVHSFPAPKLSPVAPAGAGQDSPICWVDVQTPQAQSALVDAASRAVLTHAVFVVAAAAASVAAAAAAARAAGCTLPDAAAVEVLDLDEPDLRSDAREAARAELRRGFLAGPDTPAGSPSVSPAGSPSVSSGSSSALRHPGLPGSEAGREWVLLRTSCHPASHMLCWRVAVGAASGRGGAIGRSVRRPSNGWLGRYALKRRRHNAATAIEPELGFLLANLARVGEGFNVLDPCCGGGGLLVCAAALGARRGSNMGPAKREAPPGRNRGQLKEIHHGIFNPGTAIGARRGNYRGSPQD